jgi:hypothetical protein
LLDIEREHAYDLLRLKEPWLPSLFPRAIPINIVIKLSAECVADARGEMLQDEQALALAECLRWPIRTAASLTSGTAGGGALAGLGGRWPPRPYKHLDPHAGCPLTHRTVTPVILL